MLIVNNCQLKQFYQECQKDKYIAVDTEFYWTNTYRAIPCLIQIANSKQSILIDLVSHRLNLVYLKEILFDSDLIKVFHSARQDIELLFYLFKRIPENIYDIQLSSLVIGYKDPPSLNTLCKDFLAIYIKKDNQNIDWRNRPLSNSQIDYAIKDVKYLIPLYQKVNSLVLKLNRMDWLEDKYSKLKDIKYYNQKEKNAWEKINFKPKYTNELKLLKKFSEIRERISKRLNIPPRHLISDSNIINICKYNKKNDDSCNFIKDQKIFKKIKKIRNKEFCKDIKTIATLDEQQKNKLQIARQILQEKSKLYNIHASLIANKKDLENMIKENDKKLLLGWRYQIFGKYYISLTS